MLCFIITLVQALPAYVHVEGITKAKAAETEDIAIATETTESFEGASGQSGNLNWEITKEGHLTITGSGDYALSAITYDTFEDVGGIYTYFLQGPEWLKYYKYINTAELNITNL